MLTRVSLAPGFTQLLLTTALYPVSVPMKIAFLPVALALLQLCAATTVPQQGHFRQLAGDEDAQGNLFFGILESIFNSLDKLFCIIFGANRSCVCNESTLRDSIFNDAFSEIRICKDTEIELDAELDLSGRSFALGCVQEFGFSGEVTSGPCILSGGGSNRIFVGTPTDVDVMDVTLQNGSANRGALASITGGSLSFADCTLTDGEATNDGGALFVSGAGTSVTTMNTVISSSSAANGGGLFVENRATVSLTDTRINSNSATGNGGGIAVTNADVTLSGASFAGNSAGGNGFDIQINDDEDPDATGSFVDCETSTGTGAVKFCQEDGINEVPEGTDGLGFPEQNFDNTDCDDEGIDAEPSEPECSV